VLPCVLQVNRVYNIHQAFQTAINAHALLDDASSLSATNNDHTKCMRLLHHIVILQAHQVSQVQALSIIEHHHLLVLPYLLQVNRVYNIHQSFQTAINAHALLDDVSSLSATDNDNAKCMRLLHQYF